MSKARFIEFYLAAMLKAATDGFVIRLVYEYQDATGRELVHIYTEAGPQHVNGTGDGLLTIAYDVLEALDVPSGCDGERERERERERNTPLPGQIFIKGCEP